MDVPRNNYLSVRQIDGSPVCFDYTFCHRPPAPGSMSVIDRDSDELRLGDVDLNYNTAANPASNN